MLYLINFAAALSLTILIGHFMLPVLVRLKVGQTIRSDGPQKHLSKDGTPTMGGLIFIAAMLVIFCCHLSGQAENWLWLFSFLAFALIGFLDDYFKVLRHRNLGLRGKQKLLGQFLTAGLLLLANELLLDRGTAIYVNGVPWLDLGWLYYPLIMVFIVGMVNAVNLTDGLDGLAAGVSIPVLTGFMILGIGGGAVAAWGGSYAIYAAAMVGCCLGFLFYNHYPAKVFMGDTGSMALGGAVAGFAVVTRLELVLVGFGFLYLLEALSVMLQVASFKLTHKRIFLMAPLHHHFELKGWRETKVTAVFCLLSAFFVFITLILCAVI